MSVSRVLAQMTVRDEVAAEEWYTRFFGSGPDSRPMDHLLEWYFARAAGLQVWEEPDRAGASTAVLVVDDLDDWAQRLTQVGIENDGPQPGGGARVLPVEDPDGNRIEAVTFPSA